MALQLTVGPPVLTINHGATFLVSEFDGSISNATDQGLYSRDTRFISHYQLFIDGQPWTLLSSGAIAHYASRVYMVNSNVLTEHGTIPASSVGLTLTRTISDGLHDDIDVHNYGMDRVRFSLEILIRSDFADIFEVRSGTFTRRGRTETRWQGGRRRLINDYHHRDFRRALIVKIEECGCDVHYANGRINLQIDLHPGKQMHACLKHDLIEGRVRRRAATACAHDLATSKGAAMLAEWRELTTEVTTSNEEFYRLYRQAVEDLAALRLLRDDRHPEEMLPAAGVPWFVSVFGRDSLIVSMQSMIVHPEFAPATLQRLADLQATEMDDLRDAEPGKIPHELRVGELAHFKRIPHTPYYGTADATILYLITLHEAWKWLGDDMLFARRDQVARKCLEWIDRFGDRDGDGFQEYQTRSPQGYENMGWKDAGDAVMYPDGTPVKGPKALCELQGYVYDAKLRMAEIAEYTGEAERAAELRQQAAALQRRFEEAFWCEGLGFYAYALDSEKKPVKTIASNPGHLLWSGIVSPERAEQVVCRLMQPDMWSGWGIRTLSEDNPAYNPFSYQNGSVWPHDNGIIAMGFRKYGFAKEAAMIARDISEAASFFAFHRLPELYAGVRREPGSFPVQYLGANVPQAWAAGSVFHLVRAILGLDADASRKRLIVYPALPKWLPDITLRRLRVGKAKVDIRFWREDEESRYEVLRADGEVHVTRSEK